VVITRVIENTYFAELIIRRNGALISVDARPSDSIAVALRLEAKIMAEEDLLEQATIEIADEDSLEPDSEEGLEEYLPPQEPEDLKEYLRKLDPEDFGRFTP
jgi:bifunctional DNase/RNase